MTAILHRTGRRVASATAHDYRPYRSLPADRAVASTWVQIDLGAPRRLDAVRIYPSSALLEAPGAGFPLRFKIEASNDVESARGTVIADFTLEDFPNPGADIVEFPAHGVESQYVRLTATKLGAATAPPFLAALSAEVKAWADESLGASACLSLTKLAILARGTDIAVGRPVSVDPEFGNPRDAGQLTRAYRPQGEETKTDNPENVTSPVDWRPVRNVAQPPAAVVPTGPLFTTALRQNVRYLLDSFTLNDLVYRFRERAGLPFTAPDRQTSAFWEDELTGSNAGRFMMGAANTLRWHEDAELSKRLTDVVEAIAEAQEPDGYLMAYARDQFLGSERGAYTRSWVTHGLIEAGRAGRTQAWDMLRRFYDFFNAMPELPIALRECGFGPQGTVANMRVFHTPAGRPEDVQTVQRYFQENYLLDALIARDPRVLEAYPYDRTHSYLLTCIEPYADLYRATGDRRYLEAVLGAWELYREHWQSPGGSLSMIEFRDDRRQEAPLHEPRGETCGTVFWMLINQRLHLLDPEHEPYAAEIEQAIYNVVLANQDSTHGIRYHTMLVGMKERGTRCNSCCEGQGTRILGSLPEFIFSVCSDGVYVNLFEAASVTHEIDGQPITVTLQTEFPRRPDVRIAITAPGPVECAVRIRIPSWATQRVDVLVNGELVGTGTPGSYLTIARRWHDGDDIAFTLPIGLRLERYRGIDQVGERERFVMFYGPLLMALLQETEGEILLVNSTSPLELIERLQPDDDDPLRLRLFPPLRNHEWVPYYSVGDEYFTVAPFIRSTREWI